MTAESTGSATLITGAHGMVGQALVKEMRAQGWPGLLLPPRTELDLLDQRAVDVYVAANRPQHIFHLAARVGGIRANLDAPYAFLSENVVGTLNLLDAALRYGAERVLFLGSSCVYPREATQPMTEDALLTGPLEPTNEGYALAKIVGLRALQYAEREGRIRGVAAIPCNIYGTNDHFDFAQSHVLSALVRRFVDAEIEGRESVTFWGTGLARREFIHVHDVARALLLLWDRQSNAEIVNVGTGSDVSIRELAELVRAGTGFRGDLHWDTTQPDGMPRKCVDISKLHALGFRPLISLEQGIAMTIDEYRQRRLAGAV